MGWLMRSVAAPVSSLGLEPTLIPIEVAYALPERQILLAIEVPPGTTAREALLGNVVHLGGERAEEACAILPAGLIVAPGANDAHFDVAGRGEIGGDFFDGFCRARLALAQLLAVAVVHHDDGDILQRLLVLAD